MDEYRRIVRSCDPSQMFDNLQNLVGDEKTANLAEMPVRKFYNNTFNTLLNRAMFALIKKQTQDPDDMEYFTTEGMIKFVAFQLLDQPPDGELDQAEEFDDDQ